MDVLAFDLFVVVLFVVVLLVVVVVCVCAMCDFISIGSGSGEGRLGGTAGGRTGELQ